MINVRFIAIRWSVIYDCQSLVTETQVNVHTLNRISCLCRTHFGINSIDDGYKQSAFIDQVVSTPPGGVNPAAVKQNIDTKLTLMKLGTTSKR